MKKEEAIARIQEHRFIHKTKEPRAVYISEALDMAIEALKQEPKVGYWIFKKAVFDKFGNTVECSSCHKKWKTYDELRWKKENKYCPNCGTKMIGRKVRASKDNVLDKIKAEILDEAEYAYADFDKYKEDILYAEPDELPDDDFRFGLRRAIEIIDKYKIENEKINCKATKCENCINHNYCDFELQEREVKINEIINDKRNGI